MPENTDPRHGIIGLFHVDKKAARGEKRHTQVLVKLPGFFYICEECSAIIDAAANRPGKNVKNLVKILHESPWMEFFEVEKTGHVKLPNGLFKEKLQELNPEAWLKTKEHPMSKLKRTMEGL